MALADAGLVERETDPLPRAGFGVAFAAGLACVAENDGWYDCAAIVHAAGGGEIRNAGRAGSAGSSTPGEGRQRASSDSIARNPPGC